MYLIENYIKSNFCLYLQKIYLTKFIAFNKLLLLSFINSKHIFKYQNIIIIFIILLEFIIFLFYSF